MSELVATTEQLSPQQSAVENVLVLHPEIVSLKDPEVLQAIDTLSSEFGIKESFFTGDNGPANTLLLSSIAANLVKLEASKSLTSSQKRAELEYIADTTMQVAMNHVTGFEDVVQSGQENVEGLLSDDAIEAAFQKYKSNELTEALQHKIEKNGLLNGVKESMGITNENEDSYDLLVLSIASNEFIYGFKPSTEFPPMIDSDEFANLTDDARAKRDQQNKVASFDTKMQKNWEEGLIKRRKEFFKEVGMSSMSPAFATKVNGRRYICLAADTAELLAYDEPEHRSKSYTVNDAESDLALLRHEYVHTQGSTLLDNQVGIGIEERRAEFLSGDHNGYHDIKVFFQDIYLATGFDITESIRSRTKGGKNHEIYADIISSIGLDKLVKVVTAYPKKYVQHQSSSILKNIDRHMQGYDGLIGELYMEAKAKSEDEKAVNERIDTWLDNLKPDADLDMILGYRRHNAGSHVGTSVIEERIAERLAS